MMDAMAAVEIEYVQTFTDRHGHARYYYRRKGFARVTLPDPTSPAFAAAYEAAGRPVVTSEGVGGERTIPGSMAALIASYYMSAEFVDLRESTKRGYRNMLDRFRETYGKESALAVKPGHLKTIFDRMSGTPGAARNLRKRLRSVFHHAIDIEWRTDNPVVATRAPKHKTTGFPPWTEDEIAKYEAHWPTGSRERLAMALLLYTGVRRSDVVGLGRQHVKAGRIHVLPLKTSATGKRLAIRIHPALQREIAAAPAGMTFVLTAFDKPFTAAGFTSWLRERAEKAGIVGRTPHGLRKAAGRRMAEAGCTAKEIAAVLGHATLAEVETYTADADQARLADAAVGKLGDAS